MKKQITKWKLNAIRPKISSFFFFPSLQNKKPRNAENSPKNKEKMLSLVKIHDSKNDVIVTNLLRTVRCMLL